MKGRRGMNEETLKLVLENIRVNAEIWPTPYVKRTDVERFTCGLLSENSMSAYDSQGRGPCERLKLGHCIVYPIKDFIDWFEGRIRAANERVEERRMRRFSG